MKTFIVSMVVAAVMLSGFAIYIGYINTTTKELTEVVNDISHYAKEKNWDKCNEKVNELVSSWRNHEKILCSFTDHGDLDEIKRAISELKESAYYKDTQFTVMYSSVLVVLIERLTENEMPKLENVLKTNTEYILFA